MDYQEISALIANARKRTPVTVLVRHEGALDAAGTEGLMVFPTGAGTTVLVGEWDDVRVHAEDLAAAGRCQYFGGRAAAHDAPLAQQDRFRRKPCCRREIVGREGHGRACCRQAAAEREYG